MGLFDLFSKNRDNIDNLNVINNDYSSEILEVKKLNYKYNEYNDYLCNDGIDDELKIFIENDINVSKELIDFYKNNGFGIICEKNSTGLYFNRILSPKEIIDFVDKDGIYSDEDKLIFMELMEDTYITIGISKDNYGKIFYFDRIIANSFNEFIDNLHNKGVYFLN